MIRFVLLVSLLPFLATWHVVAQVQGDLCTNPYVVTLQDPLAATCDFVEINGLDFTNFSDNPFTPSPSCDYGTNNNDIWVSVTIPANADGFKITMDSSVITSADNDYQNFKVAVYTGTSCGSLTYKTCKSSSRDRLYNNYFDGFAPGDHLYVRIYTDNSPSGAWDKPFYARFTSISTTNSNDACSNASALVPGNYCNHLATDKGESDNKAPDKLTSITSVCDPGNSAFGSFDNNQWYYFEVTATTPQPVQITITNVNCSAGDKVLQAAIWKANTQNCSTWGNGYNLTNPSSASEGDLLACAVGTGTVTILENLPVGKYWYTVDGSAGSFCEYAITVAPVTSVPIRLVSFNYKIEESGVQLYWTCMEVPAAAYFVIEKSYDGNTFLEEGFVSAGNNSGFSSFTYNTGNTNRLYYRIRVVEPGEKDYHSETIFTENNLALKDYISAYYSRLEGVKIFMAGSDQEKVGIKIINVNGAEVFSVDEYKLREGLTTIDFSGELSAGIYFVQLLSIDQSYRFKIAVE